MSKRQVRAISQQPQSQRLVRANQLDESDLSSSSIRPSQPIEKKQLSEINQFSSEEYLNSKTEEQSHLKLRENQIPYPTIEKLSQNTQFEMDLFLSNFMKNPSKETLLGRRNSEYDYGFPPDLKQYYDQLPRQVKIYYQSLREEQKIKKDQIFRKQIKINKNEERSDLKKISGRLQTLNKQKKNKQKLKTISGKSRSSSLSYANQKNSFGQAGSDQDDVSEISQRNSEQGSKSYEVDDNEEESQNQDSEFSLESEEKMEKQHQQSERTKELDVLIPFTFNQNQNIFVDSPNQIISQGGTSININNSKLETEQKGQLLQIMKMSKYFEEQKPISSQSYELMTSENSMTSQMRQKQVCLAILSNIYNKIMDAQNKQIIKSTITQLQAGQNIIQITKLLPKNILLTLATYRSYFRFFLEAFDSSTQYYKYRVFKCKPFYSALLRIQQFIPLQNPFKIYQNLIEKAPQLNIININLIKPFSKLLVSKVTQQYDLYKKACMQEIQQLIRNKVVHIKMPINLIKSEKKQSQNLVKPEKQQQKQLGLLGIEKYKIHRMMDYLCFRKSLHKKNSSEQLYQISALLLKSISIHVKQILNKIYQNAMVSTRRMRILPRSPYDQTVYFHPNNFPQRYYCDPDRNKPQNIAHREQLKREGKPLYPQKLPCGIWALTEKNPLKYYQHMRLKECIAENELQDYWQDTIEHGIKMSQKHHSNGRSAKPQKLIFSHLIHKREEQVLKQFRCLLEDSSTTNLMTITVQAKHVISFLQMHPHYRNHPILYRVSLIY